LDRLVGMYYTSVGRNGNLMLGLTPGPEGLLPKPDVRRCEEFGKEIRRRFAKPVAETSGGGKEVVLELPVEQRIDHVSIMEDVHHGERVRQYVVEALRPGGQRQSLCEGISIGHKRIQKFDPVETTRVSLRVTRAAAPPKIRSLAVYAADA
jgi:alpha-L-fucosidase